MSTTSDGPTLREVLLAFGLTHAPSGKGYHHHICEGGRRVFTGSAGQVWAWLRETGRYPLGAGGGQ